MIFVVFIDGQLNYCINISQNLLSFLGTLKFSVEKFHPTTRKL